MSDSSAKKKRLLFIVPLPPPYAGPEVSSGMLISSPLSDQFDLFVVRNNVHHRNDEKGRISFVSLIRFFKAFLTALRLLILKRPEVLYTVMNQNTSGFIRDSAWVLLGKFFGRSVVQHFRGSIFDRFYESRGILFQRYIRFVLKNIDALIVQSHWVKERLTRFIPADRVHVIYNAAPDYSEDGSPIQNKLEKEIIDVVYLNHVSVAKGFLLFCDAAKKILRERQDIRFHIFGDLILKERNVFFGEDGERVPAGDVKVAIQEICKLDQVNGRIRFYGEVTDAALKRRVFNSGDIFVLPSYSEGCPLTVFEAMAYGLSLVVTPVGALKEVLRDGENGYFVKIGDSADLKEKILFLADRPDLRQIIGEKNRELVKRKFELKVIAQQFSEVFDSLSER